MTKYLPLSLAILLTATALTGLVILLVQSTDESTKAQIQRYGTDCGDICRGA